MNGTTIALIVVGGIVVVGVAYLVLRPARMPVQQAANGANNAAQRPAQPAPPPPQADQTAQIVGAVGTSLGALAQGVGDILGALA